MQDPAGKKHLIKALTHLACAEREVLKAYVFTEEAAATALFHVLGVLIAVREEIKGIHEAICNPNKNQVQ